MKFTDNKVEYMHDESKAYWRSPHFWSRVLSKNLLGLADTQLLTGLAIQFTAMLKHCSLSVYHFQIVTDLAFLTTITHLLTVVALRNYFVKNKWINLPRIFFMLGNLAMLGYTSFVSYNYDRAGLDLSSKLACFYQGERPKFRAAFGGKWAALLIGAIGGHVTVILAMYVLHEDFYKDKQGKWAWAKYLGAFFRTWIIAPVYAIYGVYMAGTGLKDTQALGQPKVTMSEKEDQWGFGQFLPVLLLALPIFAGWESFWEEKDEDRENRFGRSARGSQGGSRSALNVLEMKTQRSRDGSNEERRIESNGPSPLHTPRERSTSRASIGPLPMPTLPSPHLSVPSPAASPNPEGRSRAASFTRPRSPSRFEERL